MSTPAPNMDLLDIDDQLTDEERLLRDTVRAFTTERIRRTSPTGSRTARCRVR